MEVIEGGGVRGIEGGGDSVVRTTEEDDPLDDTSLT